MMDCVEKQRAQVDVGERSCNGRARVGPCSVTKIKIPKKISGICMNSKKNFRHLHEDLNLDKIKNALRLLLVNREMNLIKL